MLVVDLENIARHDFLLKLHKAVLPFLLFVAASLCIVAFVVPMHPRIHLGYIYDQLRFYQQDLENLVPGVGLMLAAMARP